MQMSVTVHAQADHAISRRSVTQALAWAVTWAVTALLASIFLAVWFDNASAKGRRPAGDTTGFGELQRIAPPPLHDPIETPAPAPARFFTINKVLAKLDGAPPPSDAVRLAARQEGDTLTDATRPVARLPGGEPFGLFAFRAPEGLLWSKWRGVAADIAREADVMAQCRASAEHCERPVLRFIAVIDEARALAGRARLEAVNRAVNMAIRYTSDMEQHGVPDLWSAPLASFTSGRGDCEDYAIAKYVALRAAGAAVEDVRIVLVRDTAIGEDHAVLAAQLDGHWLILDNRRPDLLEDVAARHLMPLFAIDDRGVKLFAAPFVSRARDRGEAQIVPSTADTDAGTGGPSVRPILL
jgi:predicted transglutaminase-like cysteine proteinase